MLWPAFFSFALLQGSLWGQGAAAGTSLREHSLQVARQVMASVGHRIVAPVRLEVQNDSADAVLGGFTEALGEAGHTPRLSDLPDMSGTLVVVRRTSDAGEVAAGLDVRVEHWPERSVLYSRLWLSGAGSVDGESGGFLERVLVPVIAGAAAAVIVYLFFTVRS
jgi:hypothetical protein